MEPTFRHSSVTVTAPLEPRAARPRERTKAGTLRKEARQWREGLTWSAKLQLLASSVPLIPPYEVTVSGYYPSRDAHGSLPIEHWFGGIASALGDALGVEPAQLRLKAGRLAAAPPFSPAHLVIVLTTRATGSPATMWISCPSCGTRWALDSGLGDDCCPSCGIEGAGLPYLLGLP
jgi:hypothetical protein